jgi:hypothetical protein
MVSLSLYIVRHCNSILNLGEKNGGQRKLDLDSGDSRIYRFHGITEPSEHTSKGRFILNNRTYLQRMIYFEQHTEGKIVCSRKIGLVCCRMTPIGMEVVRNQLSNTVGGFHETKMDF